MQHVTSSARRPSQFTIGTLLLVTTLVAICLAVFRLSPCCGSFSMVAFPAFARAIIIRGQRRLQGEVLSAGQMVELFVVSMYAAVLTLLAAFAAFFPATILAYLAFSSSDLLGLSDQECHGAARIVGALASLITFLLVFWLMTFFHGDLP